MFYRIDPMAEKYASYAPYNYVLNNPVNLFDPDGNEPCCGGVGDFFSGVSAALVDNSALIPSSYRADRAVGKDPGIFKAGETLGDLLSIVQGGLEVIVGGGEAAVTTAGVVTAPAAAIGGAIVVHGGAVIGKAAGNLVSRTYNSEGSGKNGGSFGAGKDTYGNGSSNSALRNAKEQNGIPKSQQPDKTIKPNTLQGKEAGLDNRNVRQYQYTNSRGEKVIIRQDKPATYGQGGRGDQGAHYNAGKSTNNGLKQHHYDKKPN